MKKRIVRETDSSGKDTFIPQVKVLWFWVDMLVYDGQYDTWYRRTFYTLRDCERWLDRQSKPRRTVVEEYPPRKTENGKSQIAQEFESFIDSKSPEELSALIDRYDKEFESGKGNINED